MEVCRLAYRIAQPPDLEGVRDRRGYKLRLSHRSHRQTASSKRLLLLLLFIGLGLRLPAIFHEFWLDEISSWIFVHGITSPLRIFTGLHFDNHHPLNGLFIYLLGDVPPWAYRVPALLAGVGSMLLAYLIGKRDGNTQGLFTCYLFSLSYFMIHYCTEARGYAYMIFFA